MQSSNSTTTRPAAHQENSHEDANDHPLYERRTHVRSTGSRAQDAQPIATEPDEAHTSEFRTFDPTGEEWEIFRSSGKITRKGGEAMYDAVCAGCHMPDGEGAVGAGAYPAVATTKCLPGRPIQFT